MTFSRTSARGARSPIPSMALIKPKNALDSLPEISPSLFPARDKFVQGLDAHAMSAWGIKSGSSVWTSCSTRCSSPQHWPYMAHLVWSMSFAQIVLIPAFAMPARAKPMPEKTQARLVVARTAECCACTGFQIVVIWNLMVLVCEDIRLHTDEIPSIPCHQLTFYSECE